MRSASRFATCSPRTEPPRFDQSLILPGYHVGLDNPPIHPGEDSLLVAWARVIRAHYDATRAADSPEGTDTDTVAPGGLGRQPQPIPTTESESSSATMTW